jgi:5-methyltetrahydrofolate--homocysteine methyltransferase
MSDVRASLQGLLQGSGVLMLDGAMGTELDRRGSTGRCASNLADPDAVIQVHGDYVRAGTAAIITNTLTMNRIFVESHRLAIDVAEVNRAGAALARRAAGEKAQVLGNLSSTGQMLEPYGTHTEKSFIDAFEEQALCLAAGGVDGFIIETMFDLREAVCALRACRAVSALPVIVCIAYNTERDGGRTVMGNSAAECARALEAEGASAIGANCGNVGPWEMAEIVGTLSSLTRLPIAAEPNAGMPKLVGGRTVFDMDARTFAAGLAKCMDAGARILGGCCGTTPDHIRAFAERL